MEWSHSQDNSQCNNGYNGTLTIKGVNLYKRVHRPGATRASFFDCSRAPRALASTPKTA